MIMFKHCSALRIASPDTLALLRSPEFEEIVSENASLPPHKTQWRRLGFYRPESFGELDVYVGASQVRMFCIKQQERVLPGAVIQRALAERIKEYEQRTNETPHRKEIAQMKDQVTAELLPNAFIRDSHVLVIVSKEWMLFNTSSFKTVETIMTYLREVVGQADCLEHLPEWRHLNVTMIPDRAAATWLRTIAVDPYRLPASDDNAEVPEDAPRFRHLEAIALKDKAGGIVRFKDIDFDDSEVEAALESGKRVIDLAVEWGPNAGDTSLNCGITEKLVIRGLKFSEIIVEKTPEGDDAEQSAHYFDSTFAIVSSLLIKLVSSIYKINAELSETDAEEDRQQAEDEQTSAADQDGNDDDTQYGDEHDVMYPEAVAHVQSTQSASISALQRELSIGYNRAARMLETMEEKCIVSAPDTTGKRTVYEDDEV